ncbi:DDE-type integrase/transposase/recombinase [Candidatus Marsarchaeota archaeon]|nr:DDE-type integrase/transposase/recombinase [Candidatus Marsarchaeota archaeon]
MNMNTNTDLKKLSDDRKARASALLNKAVPEVLNAGVYLVPSSDGSKKYTVSHIDAYSCDCPDFEYRCKENGLYCKHIDAIILFNKLKNKVEMSDFDVDDVLDERICPNCKSDKLIQKGLRKNKSGAKQKYKCLGCGAFFVLDPAKGIKGNARIVCLVLDMYYKGNSLRDIQDTLYKNFGLHLHHETIRRWINRFMAKINDYTANLKPQTSERIHIDEQAVKVKGVNEWCWNVLDNKTRFLLANQITKKRFIADARSIMQKAKPYLSQKPTEIATDKGQFYKKAVRREFMAGWHKIHGLNVPDETLLHATSKMDNQLIERYHATFRERDKVIRGQKNEKGAERYIENWKTYYNYIKPHMTFNGLTPSQVAGISIGNERNRWLSLIKLSAQID